MASDYDKSPDYGGPEPSRVGTALAIAVIVAAVIAALLWMH